MSLFSNLFSTPDHSTCAYNKSIYNTSMLVLASTLTSCILITNISHAASKNSLPNNNSTSATVDQTPQANSAKYKNNAPETYIVKKGDTLWGIADQYLNNPWRWKEIWVGNSQIANPNLIYTQDRLLICNTTKGKKVGKDEGDGCKGIQSRVAPTKEMTDARITIEKMTPYIPMIATGEIQSWLDNIKVVSTAELASAPYILSAKNSHIFMAVDDVVYAKNKDMVLGGNYGIYREGNRFANEIDKDEMGNELRMIGAAKVVALNDNVATLRITRSFGKEVKESDRIFAQEPFSLPSVFYPANPTNTPEGKIIRVIDNVGTATVNSIVVINRGIKNKVKAGDVFVLYRKGEKIQDDISNQYLQMPAEKSGAALVFKVFNNVSYALIMNASNEVRNGDLVRAPNQDE